MIQIVCDGIGKRSHPPVRLGALWDTWASPWPATVERQQEHAELVGRVLPDAEPAPIVEPVRQGFVPLIDRYLKRPHRRDSHEWGSGEHVTRHGDRITFTCPGCRASVIVTDAELRARLGRATRRVELRSLA